MELTILQWIFQSIPECLALSSFAVVVSNHKLDLKMVLLIGLPQAIAVYLVRLLPITFGVHFIILIVVLAVNLNLQLKIKFGRSLLTALVALIILAAAEIAFITLILSVTGNTFEQVSQNNLLLIFYGLPQTIFLFLLAISVYRWKRKPDAIKEGYDA